MASWSPRDQDLHGWLAAQLAISYPALAAPAPHGAGKGTRAQALLAHHLILPVLDGLDEIPDAVRGPAITRINDALRPGEQAVVTCRTGQYRDAVQPPGRTGAWVRGAAAVQIRPLEADTIARYLRDDAGSPAAARWDAVLTSLGTRSPAGQALVTPLMAGLARTIYNPRPGEQAGDLRDPAELCSTGLADRAAVERHLFDAFIPAAYRQTGPASRWTAAQAQAWLAFLARHLENTIRSPDLAWWQLWKAQSSKDWAGVGLIVGLMAGLAAGLAAGLGAGLAAGFLTGSLAGIMAGLVVWLAPGLGGSGTPSRSVRIRPRKLAAVPVAGLGWGLVTGLGNGSGAGLAAGLGAGLLVGLYPVPGELTTAASPRAVLARDRQAALAIMLTVVLAIVLAIVLGIVNGATPWVSLGVVLFMQSFAWPRYALARLGLALRRRLPWPIMDFLADAHQRGVLRQAGAVYQFRHIELQHRLARRP
jgi:hypothetical protein